MKKQFIQFAAAAALAAGMAFAQTAPAPAPAQTQQSRHGRAWAGRRAMHRRMMQALNLTDAQKQQARQIFQQAKQNAQPLRDQLKQNRQALATAVKGDDAAQIHSLSLQRGNLEGQITGIRSEAMAKFYATLTPDQKAKADQMHQRMTQRMQQRMEQRKAANNG